MKDSILYSIIIPSYNREKLLPDAIESILEQGYDAIEIIVIDDGSTDNTKELVRNYGSKVIYHYQSNQGASVARNKGVQLASGKYISFLDSDDLFLPGKMKREQENFLRFPDAEVIVTDAEYYEDDKKIGASWMKYKGLEIEGKEPTFMNSSKLDWIQGSIFATCNFTLLRSKIHKLGDILFDTSLKRGQDWDLEIRIIRFCKLLVDPYVTCQVRRIARTKPKGDWKLAGSEANLKYQKSLKLDQKIFTKALNISAWPIATERLINSKLEELDVELLRYSPK
ncbi:MAG: glycosyltransferase family 2 protein [Flavobacteriales bacterium]|nr:glycosyltransferase family 2 protein [Flavobacteriales bacterium]